LTFFLLDEVKWAVRQPSAYATSAPSFKYLNQIEQKVQEFLKENMKHNYVDLERGVDMNLSMKDAEFIYSASDDIKDMAESGKLQEITDKYRSASEAAESHYNQVNDAFNRILTQLKDKENELIEQLDKDGVDGLHQSSSMDAFESKSGECMHTLSKQMNLQGNRDWQGQMKCN
jgi:hypothetical protein